LRIVPGRSKEEARLLDMATEAFGFAAVASMVILYALERRGSVYVLGFALSCAAAALYAASIRAWPFAVVEAIWAIVALRRWMRVRREAR